MLPFDSLRDIVSTHNMSYNTCTVAGFGVHVSLSHSCQAIIESCHLYVELRVSDA